MGCVNENKTGQHVIEHYEGHSIEAVHNQNGMWVAHISRNDGRLMITEFNAEGLPVVQTQAHATKHAAIMQAKSMIDWNTMKPK